jgi:hypothetical protein
MSSSDKKTEKTIYPGVPLMMEYTIPAVMSIRIRKNIKLIFAVRRTLLIMRKTKTTSSNPAAAASSITNNKLFEYKIPLLRYFINNSFTLELILTLKNT